MQKNRITELFGIRYPVIQAGMVWVSGHRLAAAVSNAGGLGLIGAGSMKPDLLREHIRKARAATMAPVGVNIPLLRGDAEDLVRATIEEGIRIVFTSAGHPGKFLPMLKDAGCTVVHVVPSVKHAKKVEDVGCDAVVAEAYGLSRAQYAHVLGGFSHRSDPAGAERCLAAYDALQSEGLAAFVRARDPYDAVALVDALPQPVLTWDAGAGGDAPAAGGQQAFAGMDGGAAPGAKRGRRRG